MTAGVSGATGGSRTAGIAGIDASYAQFAQAPLLRRVHGPAYLNVGWHPADDPPAALVDRLLHAAEITPTVVLDVACGRAASTSRIAARWPDAQVIGLDRNAALLPTGQPGLLRADATALPLRSQSVDVICSVEAALHFPTRRDFFNEAARVLRPGGRLVLTDLLVDPTTAGWAPLVPPGNDQQTLDAYAGGLAAAGFASCRIADVTAQTWRPYVHALVAAGAADSAEAGVALSRMLAARPVIAYIEVVAQR